MTKASSRESSLHLQFSPSILYFIRIENVTMKSRDALFGEFDHVTSYVAVPHDSQVRFTIGGKMLERVESI